MTAVETFTAIIKANKSGSPRGIYSVCSAHEGVIRASMKQALEDGSILLVESTSNQVDQFGGYTGMKPADFVEYLNRVAGDTGFPTDRLLLGGDHLGPNS
ncbi:MAG: tagatose-bisphosphate aldolase, partial [Spirochaetes bacterium]